MSEGVVSQVVKQFPDPEVLWDHKSATDIEEVIGEGCPFDAPHVNVLHELLGKVVGPVAVNDGVEEGVVGGNVKYASGGYGWRVTVRATPKSTRGIPRAGSTRRRGGYG
jgi:hypothetical protein